MRNEAAFLPGTNIQIVWDSVSRGWLKDCPRKYAYHMLEGWQSRGNSVHINFGLWYHAALELYDKARAAGDDHEIAVTAAVKAALEASWERTLDYVGPWRSDHKTKTRENLIRSIVWYLEQFKDDPIETIRLADGKAAVELTFKLELEFGPESGIKRVYAEKGEMIYDPEVKYILSGHIDRLVSFQSGTYVTDRKTTSSTLSSYYFDQYSPDDQMSGYTLAAKVLWSTPVRGVIIDAAQIAVGFTRFERGFAYRTDAQLEEWLADLRITLKIAEQYAIEDHWPRNDKSCGKFGGCVFRNICNKDPAVRQTFLESDFVKSFHDPLRD